MNYPWRAAPPLARQAAPCVASPTGATPSDALRAHVWSMGATPTRRTDPPVRWHPWAYANRDAVGRPWGRLKAWRAVATRYEKTKASFLGVLCLAAARDRLKN